MLCALLAAGTLFAACGEGQKVGNEGLLEFDEQQQGGPRLGEKTAAPVGTPGTLTVGATPVVPKTASPTAKPKPTYFDISLEPNSPYYKPGNCMKLFVGVTIRVTNKDSTPEREAKGGRSFTDKNGAFHSGKMKAGAPPWTWRFGQVASYEVVDQGLRFATAYIHVLPVGSTADPCAV
jgi:hypothetical protein